MFENPSRKIKRSAKLISVLSKYGFQDLLFRMNLLSENKKNTSENQEPNSVYVRMRGAIEELGPTFIKLGQTFSNREDLLPLPLIKELQKLQDNVDSVTLDVPQILEDEFGISWQDHFISISQEPLASASIAQVYKAVLKDGSPVILKIKRPGIDQVIKDDLMLLKDLVKLIDSYSEIADKINLKNAIAAFEKSLLEELSLVKERTNIQQFALNFRNHPETYVPKVYDDYSSDSVLCMEFVDGVKVTDVDKLKALGLDAKKISETGLRLFVAQMLEYGFFHADPHAGNILILKDGRIVFIDFGAVGVIQPNDQEILESLILNFLAKRPQKIIRNLKKMAIQYDIPDDKKFENDVRQVLEFIHNTSLKDIEVADILDKMKDVLKENKLVMPDYFYLLFKGISLIEGVGRSINPDLDIVESLKPYTKKLFFNRIQPEKLARTGFEKASMFAEQLEEIPNEVRSVLHKLDENQLKINAEIKNMDRLDSVLKNGMINLILGMIISANIISTAILWAADLGPKIGDVSVLPIIGILISLSLIILLFVRVLRR